MVYLLKMVIFHGYVKYINSMVIFHGYGTNNQMVFEYGTVMGGTASFLKMMLCDEEWVLMLWRNVTSIICGSLGVAPSAKREKYERPMTWKS